MALTQMQIIQSLGEAMNWLERELAWDVRPGELTHLMGRIGELYAALITNGQMALEVNQKGYDVVSSSGQRVSVKTTTMLGSTGHINFNPNTLDQVDRIIILRMNTEEMQIETLFDAQVAEARKLMSEKANNRGKLQISLSKLVSDVKERFDISAIRAVDYDGYVVRELENGTIEALKDEQLISPTKPVLRKMAKNLGISLLNGNGNPLNTRQLGTAVIRAISNQ